MKHGKLYSIAIAKLKVSHSGVFLFCESSTVVEDWERVSCWRQVGFSVVGSIESLAMAQCVSLKRHRGLRYLEYQAPQSCIEKILVCVILLTLQPGMELAI